MLSKWWIAFQDSNATMSKRKRRVFLGIFVALGQIAFLDPMQLFFCFRDMRQAAFMDLAYRTGAACITCVVDFAMG